MRRWLIVLREQKGLSQKDMAQKVGIAQPSYCNIENGGRNPSVRNAKKIAEILGFDWTLLYEDEKSPAQGGEGGTTDGSA